MSQPLFLVFISLLFSALVWAYGIFQKHFNGSEIYEEKVAILQEALKREGLRTRLAQENMEAFQQQVAALMPNVLRQKGSGEKGFPLRQLASVTNRDISVADKVREHISEVLFTRAKKKFREGNYSGARDLLIKMIDDFSFSVHVVDAFFLLAEGHFQLGEYEECVKIVARMVQLFPGNELTGFALLRLGKLYELRRRPEEALDIYKTVLRSFPQREVASQATRSLQAVDL